MLRRIVRFVVVLPIVVVLAALGVANDQPTRLVLDPFRPDDPVLWVGPYALYWYLFGALIAGVVIGGMATWLTQAHWRRSARRGDEEARRWRREADRLQRERERDMEASRQVT